MALGFPDELYDRVFKPADASGQPKAKSPYEISTLYYRELQLSEKFSMTLEQWSNVDRIEHKARLYYVILQSEKEKYSEEQSRRKAEMEHKAAADRPRVVDTSGIRR
jgi:hypothetical protein